MATSGACCSSTVRTMGPRHVGNGVGAQHRVRPIVASSGELIQE